MTQPKNSTKGEKTMTTTTAAQFNCQCGFSGSRGDLMGHLDARRQCPQLRLQASRRQAEAIERRHQKYAVRFVLDCGMNGRAEDPNAEPTDANLALTLGSVVRPPKPDEYPAIRMHVDTYRMAQMSATDAVRDKILERAESYAADARKFADMNSTDVTAERYITEEDRKRYAAMYRTIAGELRKVAADL